MKSDKVFVRYKNLNDSNDYKRDRPEKKNNEKKRYAQKINRNRQAFKVVLDSLQLLSDPPSHITPLISKFPTFFTEQSRGPQKESNDLLNQNIIFNTKKYLENISRNDSLKGQQKQQVPQVSSSDPDWFSDEDVDMNLGSKKIDPKLVEQVVDKMKDKPIKKVDTLKPHEKRFLEDCIREKKQQENNQIIVPQKVQSSPAQPKLTEKEEKIIDEKHQLVWSDYQERQVNTFIDMGFMTKVEENDEEMNVQVIENDDMFDQESEEESTGKAHSSSDSEEDDDIFADESPTTTIKTKEVESEKKLQGVVMVNEHIFSNIAQKLGLLPVRCSWIIKNENQRYRVSTDYMDSYYRQQKMYQMFPSISLNGSSFVNNDNIQSPEGLENLRNFNYRKTYHYNNKNKYQYKEKLQPHLKNK